jgi:hypothetical protein
LAGKSLGKQQCQAAGQPKQGSVLTWRPASACQVSIILIVLVIIILQVTG